MASIIFDLMALILELAFWIAWTVLPTAFYFTALALLFVVTFGKITVEFPKRMTRVGWTGLLQIRRTGEGGLILSPALGVVVGFVVWAIVIALTVIVYEYSHPQDRTPRKRRTLFCVLHASNQPCASPVKEK